MEKLEACESASRGLEAERSGKGMGVQPACASSGPACRTATCAAACVNL
jgi:hypothetical protein